LLTFSRGGIITGVVALGVFLFFYVLYQKKSFQLFFKYLTLGGLFSIAVWLYTSNITNGMLDNRYSGRNAVGKKKEDISSGRVAIFKKQMENFITTPLGIGVGNGKYKRQLSQEHVTAASHNEIGRLIEEHGVIGFIVLIGLLIIPLFHFWKGNNFQRAFCLAFYLLWFLTINHSAMRIAFPGFIYALSLMIIVDDE
jgi:O-antigen ligase